MTAPRGPRKARPRVVDINAASPQQEVVEILRDALKMAEAGKLRAVGIVADIVGREAVHGYALGDGSLAGLVLATQLLNKTLLMACEGDDGE